MKTTYFAIGAIAIALTFGSIPQAHATANVTWEWADSDRYTDLEHSGFGARSIKHFSKEIEAYINRVAQKQLPDGSHLHIIVTDVDLAGEFEPWHNQPYDDVRIVRSIYPPRMSLEYELVDLEGNLLNSGSVDLVDRDFNINVKRRVFTNDLYFYEKEMLGSWLRKEFGAKRKRKPDSFN